MVDEKLPFTSKLPFVNTVQFVNGSVTLVEVSTVKVPPAPLLFVPFSTTWPLLATTVWMVGDGGTAETVTFRSMLPALSARVPA